MSVFRLSFVGVRFGSVLRSIASTTPLTSVNHLSKSQTFFSKNQTSLISKLSDSDCDQTRQYSSFLDISKPPVCQISLPSLTTLQVESSLTWLELSLNFKLNVHHFPMQQFTQINYHFFI
jgi:hypothetical protein